MSTLKLETIQHPDAVSAALTLDSNGTITTSGTLVANNLTVGGNSVLTSASTTPIGVARFYARATVDQSGLTDLSTAVVSLNVVDFDSVNGFNTITNIYTIQETGTYMFTANAYLFGGNQNNRDSYIGIQKSTDSGSNWSGIATAGARWFSGDDIEAAAIPVVYMGQANQGDMFRVVATVNTGDGSTFSILPNSAPLIGYGVAWIDNDNVFTHFGGYRIA